MTDQVSSTIEIATTPEAIYALVTDIPNQHRFTRECRSAAWLPPAEGPALGARFRGDNQAGKAKWSTTCRITTVEPGRAFGYRVVGGGFIQVADWGWTIEPTDTGCRVTESFTDLRNPAIKWLFNRIVGVKDRLERNQRNMDATLVKLKELAEA
ncbi:SRPBCC family protein [Crossiella cryophila]|uniref:Ribosome-associated toxin RatA of RatAB toxin-antitoxin module n=1 Tax=Crossiella cryophila TaxID=43355 RepID=A0A7W7C4Y1_9PSEU|nr:SRPBCC family protein [Crossiella cryophila]MBB4674579.1 ribosome-associated toxin RatA of RatAB toxin-antitoxin module [Crossiella cryophila]